MWQYSYDGLIINGPGNDEIWSWAETNAQSKASDSEKHVLNKATPNDRGSRQMKNEIRILRSSFLVNR